MTDHERPPRLGILHAGVKGRLDVRPPPVALPAKTEPQGRHPLPGQPFGQAAGQVARPVPVVSKAVEQDDGPAIPPPAGSRQAPPTPAATSTRVSCPRRTGTTAPSTSHAMTRIRLPAGLPMGARIAIPATTVPAGGLISMRGRGQDKTSAETGPAGAADPTAKPAQNRGRSGLNFHPGSIRSRNAASGPPPRCRQNASLNGFR